MYASSVRLEGSRLLLFWPEQRRAKHRENTSPVGMLCMFLA
jgi:hypothetical protein